jgi:Tol biopolymer transport system component
MQWTPRWSPDGHVSLNNIWIMDINGTGHKKLTYDKGEFTWKEDVIISPDGRYIAFQMIEEGNIYLIELSYQ